MFSYGTYLTEHHCDHDRAKEVPNRPVEHQVFLKPNTKAMVVSLLMFLPNCMIRWSGEWRDREQQYGENSSLPAVHHRAIRYYIGICSKSSYQRRLRRDSSQRSTVVKYNETMGTNEKYKGRRIKRTIFNWLEQLTKELETQKV